MNAEILIDAFGLLDDDIIKSADEIRKHRSRPSRKPWFQWGLTAACFLLIVSVSISFIFAQLDLFPGPDKNLIEPEYVIEYNQAYYSAVSLDKKEILENHHLPDKIEEQMVGSHIDDVVALNGKSGSVYEYDTPEKEQSAVYLYKEKDGTFYFLLFCNYLGSEAASSEQMFSLYGIQSASDISEIKIGKQRIRDRASIEAFYNAMIASEAMNEDAFQLEVFKRKPEEEQQKLSAKLADEAIFFQIITADGIVADYISYYPSVHFINWGTYHYKVSEKS